MVSRGVFVALGGGRLRGCLDGYSKAAFVGDARGTVWNIEGSLVIGCVSAGSLLGGWVSVVVL